MKPLTIFRILKYPAPTIINILLFLFHLPTPISFLARKRVLKQTPHIISFHVLKNSMYLEQLFLQLTTILPPSIKLNINFLLSNNKYSSTFPTCSKMSFQGCVLCCAESFSCVRLCDPMDCSPCHGDSPGKNTGVGCHALLQGSPQPRDRTQVFHIAGRFFTI